MRMDHKHILALCVCAFVIALDQLLKFLSQHVLYSPTYGTYLAWEPFLNPGIAFGLPVPWYVQLVVTPFLLWGIYRWATREMHRAATPLALGLVFGGALSNAIDRMLVQVTIDYLRIGTAVINLADVSVIIGIATLFLISSHTDKTTP